MTPQSSPATTDSHSGNDRSGSTGRDGDSTDYGADSTDHGADSTDHGADSTDHDVDRSIDGSPASTAGRVPVDAVESALAKLADGTAPRSFERRQPADHRHVVRTARRATRRVDAAATFLSAGGLARLREAVEAARRRGDEAAVRRGQAVVEEVSRFRDAAAGRDGSGGAADDRSRGTILSGGGQTPDR